METSEREREKEVRSSQGSWGWCVPDKDDGTKLSTSHASHDIFAHPRPKNLVPDAITIHVSVAEVSSLGSAAREAQG